MPEARLAPEQRKQMFALLPRRDRGTRAADRQHAIVAALVVQAIGEVVAEIVVADRLAGGQRAVAEHQKRLARAHPLDLTRQRLEVRRRPDDGIGQAGYDQRALESELGMLKGEHGLLHADRRQQHELRDAGVARRSQNMAVRSIVDRPGVSRRAGARGHAGHHRIEALAAKAVAPASCVGHIADAQRGVGRCRIASSAAYGRRRRSAAAPRRPPHDRARRARGWRGRSCR